jgi:signal peptidase I
LEFINGFSVLLSIIKLGGIAMMKSLLIIFLFLFLLGCEEQSITDSITQESPQIVVMKQGLITVENHNDGMARRNLEYISENKGNIAVDPNYFNHNDRKRGDVIYYKTPSIDENKYPRLNPPEYNIARVIALPGEEIEIKKGQVYINNKKLDTFYGKALSWGLEEEEYFKTVNKPGSAQCDESCQKTMKEYFNMEMAKVKVPVGHVFVMGDTWWRSIDSQIFGSLPVASIKGRVLGYAGSSD